MGNNPGAASWDALMSGSSAAAPQAKPAAATNAGAASWDALMSAPKESKAEVKPGGDKGTVYETSLGRLGGTAKSALYGANAEAAHTLANIADLTDRASDAVNSITGVHSLGILSGARDWLRNVEQAHSAIAEQAMPRDPTMIERLNRAVFKAPADIARIATASRLAGGPAAGMAGLGAVDAEDQGIGATVKGAAEGLMAGKVMGALSQFTTPVRVAGNALTMGAQAYANGGDPVEGATMGGLFGAIPTGGAARLGDLARPGTAQPWWNKLTAASDADTPYINKLTGDSPAAAKAVEPASAAGRPDTAASPAEAIRPNAGPSTVGAAAASQEASAIPPREAAAGQATAEIQKLLEKQEAGIRDARVLVPGVHPNAAEIEQSANAAREMKALGQAHPEMSQQQREVSDMHNHARREYFAETAGSPVDVHNLKAARTEQAQADLSAAWGNKTAADPTPVAQLAEEIKAGPDGRRPLVRNVVDSVLREMTGKDGAPITDPELLYGVRKHVADLIEEQDGVGGKKNARAEAQLLELRKALDDTIEKAAPGYRQYLENFAKASGPIDAMEFLQQFEPRLYDAQNRMQYSNVQRMMRQIVEARKAPGLNQAKSIPDEVMEKLWNLRDDLRRSASAQDLARAAGSDTAQNLGDSLRYVGKLATNAAAHGIAGALSPGFGNVAVEAVKSTVVKPYLERKEAAKARQRFNKLLFPDREE